MTYLNCYDDHRNFTEDVRKRFSDTTRYTVRIFTGRDEFIAACARIMEPGTCKVAIIGVPESKEQFGAVEEMVTEVNKSDPRAGIILLALPDRIDELKKVVRFNIDAYIPRNVNSILRIHNTVKKLISEQSIHLFRKKRNMALYILMGFIILAIMIFVIAKLRLPGYF